MNTPKIKVVIGKNFGDEGKGLAVDFLSAKKRSTLVIKHNGGAQAGHTVDLKDKRFVFHQLSSGSFRNAATFWSDTYFADIYKINDEYESFVELSGFHPKIYASYNTPITTVDDILINMAAETARGEGKHGSCGMGIYEATLRNEAGYGITVGELAKYSHKDLTDKLLYIRNVYTEKRLRDLGLSNNRTDIYYELLTDDNIIFNSAHDILLNLKYITVVYDIEKKLSEYEQLIFETGQGLLLDSEKKEYYPFVTASRTGIYNPYQFVKKYSLTIDEIIYVTRSYLTRHGRGPLLYECTAKELGNIAEDRTNIYNEWQEGFRYAFHPEITDFTEPVSDDLSLFTATDHTPEISLMITHLNETDNKIIFADKKISTKDISSELKDLFSHVYLSDTPFSEDIYTLTNS